MTLLFELWLAGAAGFTLGWALCALNRHNHVNENPYRRPEDI